MLIYTTAYSLVCVGDMCEIYIRLLTILFAIVELLDISIYKKLKLIHSCTMLFYRNLICFIYFDEFH